MITESDCLALDRADPLSHCRERFSLPDDLIYFDGNSLGPMPRQVMGRVESTVKEEWGRGLIGSWNDAHWFDLPQILGDRLGKMLGANVGQVVVCDSTSINLFKCIQGALNINSRRSIVLAQSDNFPTDLYILEGIKKHCNRSIDIKLMPAGSEVMDYLTDDIAVVLLSHINYRTGSLLNLEEITAACASKGIMVVWDLCHSAGVVPIELDRAGVDFAVGCGYKFLNGGPGAPSFLYVASRHIGQAQQPLSGWWGHIQPFAFDSEYSPDPGIKRYLCGTQPIISMQAMSSGLETFNGVDIAVAREKSMALTQLFIDLLQQECEGMGIETACAEDAEARGSQVSFSFEYAYELMQALIEQGVVGDFRAPNIMRFGLAPLFNQYIEVWSAVQKIKQCTLDQVWLDGKYAHRKAVT